MSSDAPADILIRYKASPTLKRFHRSQAFYRGVRGPVGSGKSTGMCFELFRRGREQAPGRGGLRRTRFAVIRNTYRELEDTTIKTWSDWFDSDIFGRVNGNTMSHTLEFGDVQMEVMFRALDKPKDVKKLLSLELTGAWVNEAKEVQRGIIDTLGDRVGRYPATKDGGCTWSGVIMDTNSPDDDHWWFDLAETNRPDPRFFQFFTQPGGLLEIDGRFIPNLAAENIENLPRDYYATRMHGKRPGHIRIYYCNQYGFVVDGRPVYPEYVDATHCTTELLQPVPGVPLRIGIDFGLTPAAVIGQRLVNGRWIWIDEVVTEHMGIKRFGVLLKRHLQEHYREFLGNLVVHGDPAGTAESQTDEETCFALLNAAGIPAVPAPSNDPVIRREAVVEPLCRNIDGKPGLLVSPRLKVTRKGMAGGYCYKRLQVVGDERFHDKPDKNRFSHPCEAGQYMMLGAGEGNEIVRTAHRPTTIIRPPAPGSLT